MKDKKGKVYIIGAGPGDWKLISVKGLEKLKKADVILYDFLATDELLRFAKRNARVICVGKRDGMHLKEQYEINKLLFKYAGSGKSVVRLKGGDPFLFSRGIEEALYLKNKGIDFEIIPGITSAFAAPESFGIPLTKKGRFSSVAVLTGRKSSGEKLDAPSCDTLIYLMAVGNIKKVVKAVMASGRDRASTCAIIEAGTTSGERIVTGRLDTIVELADSFSVRPPGIFIVGDVVGYGKRIYEHKYKKR